MWNSCNFYYVCLFRIIRFYSNPIARWYSPKTRNILSAPQDNPRIYLKLLKQTLWHEHTYHIKNMLKRYDIEMKKTFFFIHWISVYGKKYPPLWFFSFLSNLLKIFCISLFIIVVIITIIVTTHTHTNVQHIASDRKKTKKHGIKNESEPNKNRKKWLKVKENVR